MSIYPSLPSLPNVDELVGCLETTHGPHGCQGCINCVATKTDEKPWYMTVKPVTSPVLSIPNPIVLLKVGSWVLEKWDEEDTESDMSHYCTDVQWKKNLSIDEIRDGYCLDCCEDVPTEMVGAWTMHNWSHLQKYDKDIEKYGKYGEKEMIDYPDLKVYR